MKTRRQFLQGALAAGAVVAVAPALLVEETPRIVGELGTWNGPLIVENPRDGWPIQRVQRFDCNTQCAVLYGDPKGGPECQEALRFVLHPRFQFETAETYVGRSIGDLLTAIFKSDLSLVA